MNYIKLSKRNFVILIIGFVLFILHLHRMKRSLETGHILGKGDQWSLNLVFAQNIPFLFTIYSFSFLHLSHRYKVIIIYILIYAI